MFRPAAVVVLLAMSGCLAAAPVPVLTPAPAQDDLTVTATRVVPLVHEVDTWGRIAMHACPLTNSEGCENILVGQVDEPTHDFGDPAALFWRVNVRVDWTSESLVSGLRLSAYATTPCGPACLRERSVGSIEGGYSIALEGLEVFLEPGETGIRLRLQAQGTTEASWSEAAVDYHLAGTVAGYRPVADPVVIA